MPPDTVFTFEVVIEPVAKQRAREKFHTPTRTKDAEWQIRETFRKQFGEPRLRGPIRIEVWALLPMPASIPKRDQETITPYRNPKDWDNLGKTVSDALNDVAYLDDKQVIDAHIYKRYARGIAARWYIVVSLAAVE